MKVLGIAGSTRKKGKSGVYTLVRTVLEAVMQAAADAGKLLGDRLRNGHDRREVAGRMQAELMAKFAESA